MPIYEYEILDADGRPVARKELLQRIADPPLTRDPETGLPMRRVISQVALTLKHSTLREKRSLSADNLSRHGFTRYERASDGAYVRTAGRDGPPTLGPV